MGVTLIALVQLQVSNQEDTMLEKKIKNSNNLGIW